MTNLTRRMTLALGLGWGLGVSSASAASLNGYPSKPIRMLVGLPPGGSADLVARLIATKLQATLGQPIVVDNKPGASGNIGVDIAMHAPADGYTIVFMTSAVTITPWLQKPPFDITKDLVPVTMPNLSPYVLTVNSASAYRTLQEFLAAAKARPGEVTYGSYGVGSPTHLSMAWLGAVAGVSLNHVPYKGSAQVMNDLLGGQIQAAFDLPANVAPHVRAGKLRVLATGSSRPSSNFPGAPTIASIFPGFDSDGWQGVMAPAGTPTEIVNFLQVEIAKVLKMPDVRARLLELGFEPVGSKPDVFAQQIRLDLAKWGRLIKELNITPVN
jgi:tripartite-type tricarboxylate transporter receptor subunit TctC